MRVGTLATLSRLTSNRRARPYTMANIDAIVRKQQDLYHCIGRAAENLKKTGKDKLTRFLLDARIQLLDSNWDKFSTSHDLLVSQTEEFKSHEYFSNDFYSACEEVYMTSKAEMLTFRDRLAGSNAEALDVTLRRKFVALASEYSPVSGKNHPPEVFGRLSIMTIIPRFILLHDRKQFGHSLRREDSLSQGPRHRRGRATYS